MKTYSVTPDIVNWVLEVATFKNWIDLAVFVLERGAKLDSAEHIRRGLLAYNTGDNRVFGLTWLRKDIPRLLAKYGFYLPVHWVTFQQLFMRYSSMGKWQCDPATLALDREGIEESLRLLLGSTTNTIDLGNDKHRFCYWLTVPDVAPILAMLWHRLAHNDEFDSCPYICPVSTEYFTRLASRRVFASSSENSSTGSSHVQ
jgi:hypothetical protein